MEGVKGVIDILRENGGVALPPLLYKYYPFNKHTQRIFENNEVYFQSPEQFNDPFDSKIRFLYEGSTSDRERFLIAQSTQYRPDLPMKFHLDYVKRIMKQGLDLQDLATEIQSQLMDLRKQMGVFCMTEDRENILMWSHYTKDHIGFCIEFKTNNAFFSQARPVRYNRELPCVNLLMPWNELIARGADGFLTKAPDWEYECEWRIVNFARTGGVGVQTYPSQALSGLILGCRMSSENKRLIMQWCRAREPRSTLYQAKEKDREFGLDIIPIPYEDTTK